MFLTYCLSVERLKLSLLKSIAEQLQYKLGTAVPGLEHLKWHRVELHVTFSSKAPCLWKASMSERKVVACLFSFKDMADFHMGCFCI